ncbi:MAG: hypothetical protein PGN24_00765 [Microbacterium arborescens]
MGNVTPHSLDLVELQPVQKRVYTYVWERSPDFVAGWWGRSQPTTERYISIRREEVEVARCIYVLRDKDPTNVEFDILAFEVAQPLRGQGIGRAALSLIRESYPGPRMTALNDSIASSGFWESLGWQLRADEADLTSLLGGDPRERGTYVAPD